VDERARKKEGGELNNLEWLAHNKPSVLIDRMNCSEDCDACACKPYYSELCIFPTSAEMYLARETDAKDHLAKIEMDKLNRENVQLAHDLGECMAEREELRTVLGKMLDIAHELQRIGALYGVD